MAHKTARPGTAATWLNHWSIGRAYWDKLPHVDHIGIDGTLLQLALKTAGMPVARTSADLVLPVVLNDVLPANSNVALIGAAPGVAEEAAKRISNHNVATFDGFDELKNLRKDPSALDGFDPQLIVVGLGAGLQDEVAVELKNRFPNAAIATAGGWIDQLAANEQYFPHWVHNFRLGWLWRIIHEPRRLLGRYTIGAVEFLAKSPLTFRKVKNLPHEVTETSFDC